MAGDRLPARLRVPAFVAILLVAAAIRIGTADYGLWFDEIASTVFARQPLSHLWGEWMVRETNPPLFYTLLKGWIAIVGSTDFALRMLPVTIGLAGIGLAGVLATRVGGVAAGLLATALFTLSAANVDLGQEVRGYILAHAAVLAATWAMIAYHRGRGPVALVAYAAAALMALHCHTTMIVFVVLANIAMLVLLRRAPRMLAGWLAANGVVAIGWAWWLWITLAQLGAAERGGDWITHPSFAAAWRMTEGIYLPGYALAENGPGEALLLAAAIAGVAAYVWRDRRAETVLLAILALGAPVVLFALSQLTPIFVPRTLFWASGPWIVLVATAITGSRFHAAMLALAALVLAFEALVLVRWLPQRAEEDWRAALAVVAREHGDAILLVEGDAMALAADHYRGEVAPAVRLRVVARPAGNSDGWGDGLSAAPHMTGAGAAQLLRTTGILYTYRRGDSDPAAYLHRAGSERRLTDPPRDRQPYVSRWAAR